MANSKVVNNFFEDESCVWDTKDISEYCWVRLDSNISSDKLVNADSNWKYNCKLCIISLKELGIKLLGKELQYWRSNIDLINDIALALVKKGIVDNNNYPYINNICMKISKKVYDGQYSGINHNIMYDWYYVLNGKKRIRLPIESAGDRAVAAAKPVYGLVMDLDEFKDLIQY